MPGQNADTVAPADLSGADQPLGGAGRGAQRSSPRGCGPPFLSHLNRNASSRTASSRAPPSPSPSPQIYTLTPYAHPKDFMIVPTIVTLCNVESLEKWLQLFKYDSARRATFCDGE